MRPSVTRSRQLIAPAGNRVGCAAEALEQDLPVAVAAPVEALVGIAVLADGRSLQRHAGKQASRPRLAENARPQLDVGGRLGVAADGTRGDRRVAADLELVLQQLLEAALVHDLLHQG